ncbi:MAG: hypothetical protein Fur0043_06310 [Anaerolineales bacterium]
MDFLSLICFLCILPLGILFFFGLVIGILYRDRRKHAEAWQEVARRAGLTFNAPGWILGRPTLNGDWHGRAVRVYTVTRGGAGRGTSSAYMRVEMAAQPPQNAFLSISERNFFSQLGRTGEEIPTNDAEFDHRFVTRGNPPEFVHGLLAVSGLRRLLLQARYVNIETVEGNLRYEQLNVETDADVMLFLFSLLFDLAEAAE